MSLDAVLKVGGSLGRGQDLLSLCREIGRLGARYRLLVVPGGGESADVVRNQYRRHGLSETTAHRMALLAMDQYGCLLGDLTPGSVLSMDILSARQAAESGRVPILLPASLLIQADPLPHCWQVTSDAIAAWLAGLACASRLILLKDVDGLYSAVTVRFRGDERRPLHRHSRFRGNCPCPFGAPTVNENGGASSQPSQPIPFFFQRNDDSELLHSVDPAEGDAGMLIPQLSAEELAGHRGGVDEYLATVLASTNVETWVVNGRSPARLVELLDTGRTLGTHISRGRGNPSAVHHPERR